MEPVVIVIMLALSEYVLFGILVGAARGRTGVKAPAVSGNEEFERYFRVHYNTLEQLVMFVPAIWFFAIYVHMWTAVSLGLLFVVGRAVYARSYVRDPASRGIGTMMSVLPVYVMVIGALGGALWQMVSATAQ